MIQLRFFLIISTLLVLTACITDSDDTQSDFSDAEQEKDFYISLAKNMQEPVGIGSNLKLNVDSGIFDPDSLNLRSRALDDLPGKGDTLYADSTTTLIVTNVEDSANLTEGYFSRLYTAQLTSEITADSAGEVNTGTFLTMAELNVFYQNDSLHMDTLRMLNSSYTGSRQRDLAVPRKDSLRIEFTYGDTTGIDSARQWMKNMTPDHGLGDTSLSILDSTDSKENTSHGHGTYFHADREKTYSYNFIIENFAFGAADSTAYYEHTTTVTMEVETEKVAGPLTLTIVYRPDVNGDGRADIHKRDVTIASAGEIITKLRGDINTGTWTERE
ncbi:MAG: hypothetical protein ACQEQV_07585 [Fibrobacterota bacterium]